MKLEFRSAALRTFAFLLSLATIAQAEPNNGGLLQNLLKRFSKSSATATETSLKAAAQNRLMALHQTCSNRLKLIITYIKCLNWAILSRNWLKKSPGW